MLTAASVGAKRTERERRPCRGAKESDQPVTTGNVRRAESEGGSDGASSSER